MLTRERRGPGLAAHGAVLVDRGDRVPGRARAVHAGLNDGRIDAKRAGAAKGDRPAAAETRTRSDRERRLRELGVTNRTIGKLAGADPAVRHRQRNIARRAAAGQTGAGSHARDRAVAGSERLTDHLAVRSDLCDRAPAGAAPAHEPLKRRHRKSSQPRCVRHCPECGELDVRPGERMPPDLRPRHRSILQLLGADGVDRQTADRRRRGPAQRDHQREIPDRLATNVIRDSADHNDLPRRRRARARSGAQSPSMRPLT